MTSTLSSNPSIKKPVYRKLLPGGISAAVFENTRDGRTFRSVNLQRSYRKNEEWKRMSMYLDHENIPFVIEALQSTFQFLNDYPVGGVSSISEQNPPEADDSYAEYSDSDAA